MAARNTTARTPNDPVRDTDKMKTTSQMVMNLTDRELVLYVIPGKMDYEGMETHLPDGYTPKIKVRVYGYRNDGKEVVGMDPDTGKPIEKPTRLVSDKTADLTPPLGTYGGPCRVVDRIMDRIRQPGLRDRMIGDAQTGDLSNTDAAKIYPPIQEQGSGFKSFVIKPHAQFRMDYRSIPVRALVTALDSYLRWLLDLRANNPEEYRDLRQSTERVTWVDPKSKLKLVLDFTSGDIEIVTAYWKGKEDPPPMACPRRVAARYLRF
jgi:hypothetical protein